MQLTPWRPFHEMDDLFRRYFRGNESQARYPANVDIAWEPSADISETKKEYVVKAVLPGVAKEDIQIDLKDNRLTICGTRANSSDSDEETFHRVESFYGSFSRTFALPDNVDAEKLHAECKKGVLSVHLPKTKAAKAKSAINIPVA